MYLCIHLDLPFPRAKVSSLTRLVCASCMHRYLSIMLSYSSANNSKSIYAFLPFETFLIFTRGPKCTHLLKNDLISLCNIFEERLINISSIAEILAAQQTTIDVNPFPKIGNRTGNRNKTIPVTLFA